MAFDTQTYTRLAGRLDLAGIDFDVFAERPLDRATLRCLRYMHDVEHHTVCYLRDLLVTRSHRDPEVTAFLTMWAFEEFWHGDALGTVLAAHGEVAGPVRIEAVRRALRRDRLAPFLHCLGSAVTGHAYVAIHMAWGAINEWTTQAGYARLSALARHPVLSELLRRIMRQEGRHIDFYATQAARRLEDRRAQRLTRLALRRLWRPVGSDLMPEAEVSFMVHHLFGGEEGRAMIERIDRRISRLPGLDGLRLLEDAAAAYAA
jgi:hypothetical protein